MSDDLPNTNELDHLKELSERISQIRSELSKVIVGQESVIEQLLITILAGGHCLLVGVPGLAKTLMISNLAKLIGLNFSRIQFTPDLMPADITGTEVIQEDKSTGTREFRFIPGPVFANVVLADEINRTPPKTQAALLEAMQERQVTAGGQRHSLPNPFFVLATQNPIEQEGTYPLPEAQLDRFMLNVKVEYPSEEDELEVVLRTTGEQHLESNSSLSAQDLTALCSIVRKIAITPSLALAATKIARCTRPEDETATVTVRKCVRWGAGPRASQYIVLGAKARAAMQGSPVVRREDIDFIAAPVLRHRMRLNFQAEAEGVAPEDVIADAIAKTPDSTADSASSEQIANVLRS